MIPPRGRPLPRFRSARLSRNVFFISIVRRPAELTHNGMIMLRPTACVTAIVAAAAVTASAWQLTERPIAGVLTHPAIAYATRPTRDAVSDLKRRLDDGS